MSTGSIEIRRLGKSDIREAMALVWEVFSEFEAPEYSDEGVAEFRRYIAPEAICGRMDRGELVLWGGYDGKAMAGVVALRTKDHISLLFVRKEYQRQGLARRLFEAAKQAFTGTKEITVNSSPYAVEVYKHLGFVPVSGEMTMKGIRFTPMKYTL